MPEAEKLHISLHAKQLEILHDNHRFKCVICGRRFGKTTLCANVIAIRALSKPDQVLWIVSPTFPQTMYMWRQIKKIIPKQYVKSIKEGEKFILLINGSTIWAKSGDNPDGLVGEGLDFCAIDEAARCKEEVWEVLRPALSDKMGECWFITTPKGKGWIWRIFQMEKHDDSYKSFQFPSHDNPVLKKEELVAMKAELPELVYSQEVLAQFIDGGGVVFRNLEKCIIPGLLRGPELSRSYVIGCDLGKHQDFTVLTVGDTTNNHIVALERFNRLDWTYQKEKIKDLVKTYNNAALVLDTTGLGDTIYDDLTTDGLAIEPYKFTNTSKNLLISNLMRTIDNGLVSLPDDADLRSEFESYTYSISDTGLVRYGAEPGFHDDIVTSVALCVWGMNNCCVNVIGRPEGKPGKDEVQPKDSFYDESDSESWYNDEDYEDAGPKYGNNKIKMY